MHNVIVLIISVWLNGSLISRGFHKEIHSHTFIVIPTKWIASIPCSFTCAICCLDLLQISLRKPLLIKLLFSHTDIINIIILCIYPAYEYANIIAETFNGDFFDGLPFVSGSVAAHNFTH